MASKKTSTTTRKKGPSPKPAAKTNAGPKTSPVAKASAGVKESAAAKTKSVAKSNGKTSDASKPAKSARKTAAPEKATKPAAAAITAAKSKSGKRHAPIVHWEIQSQQPEALHEFYGEVFGWRIDANNPMNYGMVASKGEQGGIDGGIGGSPSAGARVLVYASVTSIPSTLKRIEELGGKTIMPRTDIGPVVMAMYLDPEGNAMGLIEDT